MKKAIVPALLSLSTLLATSCGGAVGDGVRPKDLTGAAALGSTAVACAGEPKLAKPLVVDLDSSARVELEASMRKGVVVVAYDCASLRVLPTCRLAEGAYGYAGVSRKEQVVQMKNQDELSVNLPLSSGKLGGELKSGRSIDLALVLVGLKSTTIDKVKRDELSGGCEGATHFIQTASLGAFSMATGSAGKAAAVAELFKVGASGSSESSRSATSTDGSLDACRKSDPDAPAPPTECQSPLTVQLSPIAVEAAPKAEKTADANAPKPIENPCREGYLYANGICTKSEEGAHLCKPREVDDCLVQCEKGSAESCYNYAAYIGHDFKIRRAFSKKACDLGFADGCGDYAIFDKIEAKDAPPTSPRRLEGVKFARQGCDMGGAKSCHQLGLLLWGYDDDSLKDLEGGRRAWERSCSLGEAQGCYELSGLYWFGTFDGRVAKDQQKAIRYQERACQSGMSTECTFLAERLIEADPPLRDVDRAARIARSVCTSAGRYCKSSLDVLVKAGRNAETLALAKVACDQFASDCTYLAEFYEEGKITPRDAGKARVAWARACENGTGSTEACNRAKSTEAVVAPAKAPKRKPRSKK